MGRRGGAGLGIEVYQSAGRGRMFNDFVLRTLSIRRYDLLSIFSLLLYTSRSKRGIDMQIAT